MIQCLDKFNKTWCVREMCYYLTGFLIFEKQNINLLILVPKWQFYFKTLALQNKTLSANIF